MTHTMSRPSLFNLLSEPGMAILEKSISIPYKKIFARTAKGDGHPVMVLPGFMGSETSTKALREYIAKLGYDVYDWGMGRNFGKLDYVDLLLTRVDEIYFQTGQPVSLIGWSLGGVYARQIAKENPKKVRQLITMGSPFSGLTEPNNISWLYSLISGGKKVNHINQAFLDSLPLPAPVPTTAIYSKSDGIVNWKMCMEAMETEIHQNIEVRGSHIGMGSNFSILRIIADRLQKDKHNWERFSPKGLLNQKVLYPSS
jgi:pimeloyl-ACP methyl ester carboxylesterase